MTKEEMISTVARICQLTKVNAKMAIETIVGILRKDLALDGTATLDGIGIFKVHVRPPGKRRNPKTGESFDGPAITRVLFKASKKLKDKVVK